MVSFELVSLNFSITADSFGLLILQTKSCCISKIILIHAVYNFDGSVKVSQSLYLSKAHHGLKNQEHGSVVTL